MRLAAAIFALCVFSAASSWGWAQAVKQKAPPPPAKASKNAPATSQPRSDAKSNAATAPVAQQPSVEQLARQLASNDAKARHAAADELADLGRRAAAATPALAKALASEDADTRWRAARAIGEVGAGAASAAEALAGKLADREPLVRAHAARALGLIGAAESKTAVPKLVEASADEDARVRRAAIGALIRLNADRQVVVPLFRKALEDAEPSVLMPALHQLTEMGDQAVPLLEEALKSEKARYWALLALSELGPKASAAADGITAALTDERPEVRMQAAMALGAIGADAKAAVPALTKSLDDEQPSVRYGAAYALGKVADKRAYNGAGEVRQKRRRDAVDDQQLGNRPDESQRCRHRAPRCRSDHQSAGKQEPTRPSWRYPRAGRAEGPFGVDCPGVRARHRRSRSVGRGQHHGCTRRAGAQSGSPRGQWPEKSEAPRVCRAVLQRIGPDSAAAVPQLVEALKTADDPAFRREVNFALAAIGPAAAPAVPELAKTFDDDSLAIAQPSAAYALGKIGPASKAAAPAVGKIVLSTREPLHRLAAVFALRQINPDDPSIKQVAAPLALEGLASDRELVRLESAKMLGEIGVAAPGAVEALKKAADDESGAVREAAAAALKKLQAARQ